MVKDFKNRGNLDLGVHFGHVQKSGSWYAYQDTKLGQGKEVKMVSCWKIIQS